MGKPYQNLRPVSVVAVAVKRTVLNRLVAARGVAVVTVKVVDRSACRAVLHVQGASGGGGHDHREGGVVGDDRGVRSPELVPADLPGGSSGGVVVAGVVDPRRCHAITLTQILAQPNLQPKDSLRHLLRCPPACTPSAVSIDVQGRLNATRGVD